MQTTDIIDRAVFEGLLDSVGGDCDFLTELVQTYFDDSPQQIAAMQAAVAAGDTEALRRAAHSLKSNSANFGALTLSAHCKELELMGKAGAAEKIAVVAGDYQGVKVALGRCGMKAGYDRHLRARPGC